MYLGNVQLGNFSNEGVLGALGDRTLKQGSSGADVIELQKLLINYFKAKGQVALPKYGADGGYGSESYTWVTKFQQDKGLTADGIAGPMTISALRSAAQTGATSAAPSAAREASTSVVTSSAFAPESRAQKSSSSSSTSSKAWYMDTMNQVYMGVVALGLIAIIAMSKGGSKKKTARA